MMARIEGPLVNGYHNVGKLVCHLFVPQTCKGGRKEKVTKSIGHDIVLDRIEEPFVDDYFTFRKLIICHPFIIKPNCQGAARNIIQGGKCRLTNLWVSLHSYPVDT